MIVLRKWVSVRSGRNYLNREKKHKMYLLFGIIPLFVSING